MAQLSGRIGAQKALVAIARKLLVVGWHVLTDREADRDGDEAGRQHGRPRPRPGQRLHRAPLAHR